MLSKFFEKIVIITFYFMLMITFSCKPKEPIDSTPPPPIDGSDTTTYTIGPSYDYQATIDLASKITQNSANIRGRITVLDDEHTIVQHGHIWSSQTENPTVITTNTRTMLGELTNIKPFVSELTGLSAGTMYYFRLYFFTDDDNEFYHPIVSVFKTLSSNSQPPDILTIENVDSLKNVSARVSGYLLNLGSSNLTAHGICWSQTNEKPTIDDNSNNIGTAENAGKFEYTITGLTSETTYYYRAYATNSVGTNYGEAYSFTTKPDVPEGFVRVEGGTFTQGNTNGDDDEKPEHLVTLNNFYISEHEVTNQEFADFLNSYGSYIVQSGTYQGQHMIDKKNITQLSENGGIWSVASGYEDYPMVYVSWYGAYTYCQYYNYRLPTESEWEYAAKGGNMSQGYTYSGGNTCGNVAWFSDNANNSHIVKQKTENELEIYDMSGNVWEWCNDWYGADYYGKSPSENPTGPVGGAYRIIRGGSWANNSNSCRNTERGKLEAYQRNDITGFRCVIDEN